MYPKPDDIVAGKYRIVRLIGDGGMGTVYEARHQVLTTQVALKFLHADLVKRPGLAARFAQEARVSASIQSPHVARVTDVDTTEDGTPYLVMEFLTGETLQAVLDRQKKFGRDEAVDYALQILSGLEAAHALGVVHRDLKPENVFITPSTGGPVLKLIDFGIAKLRASNEYTRGLTRAGVMLGTPEYMAPEQLYGADRVDHRADLYSLGAMLYEMLAGRRPADGQDATEIVGHVVAGEVRRLDALEPTVGPALADVVHRAMAPDAAHRFENALALRLALAPFAGKLSHAGRLAATPPPGVAPTWPPDGPAVSATPAQRVPTPHAPAIGAGTGAPFDPARGSTQDVSPEEIQRNIQLSAQVPAQPFVPPAGGYGTPSPGGYGTPSPAAYPSAATTVHRRPRRAFGAVLAIVLGILVTGGAIAGVVAMRNQNASEDDAPINPGQPAPQTTISAQTPSADIATATPAPGSIPAPIPTRAAHSSAPRAQSDAGAKADAGAKNPFPFQLPSGFPPLPSAFPTAFPTTFPQIPGFPAPAASGKPMDGSNR